MFGKQMWEKIASNLQKTPKGNTFTSLHYKKIRDSFSQQKKAAQLSLKTLAKDLASKNQPFLNCLKKFYNK